MGLGNLTYHKVLTDGNIWQALHTTYFQATTLIAWVLAEYLYRRGKNKMAEGTGLCEKHGVPCSIRTLCPKCAEEQCKAIENNMRKLFFAQKDNKYEPERPK